MQLTFFYKKRTNIKAEKIIKPSNNFLLMFVSEQQNQNNFLVK